LPVLPIGITSEINAQQYENRTWTDMALGELQNGIADMWATDTYVTLEESNTFLFTTPFMMEKYAALMERQTNGFIVDIKGLTAGIDVGVYGIIFVLLMCLTFIGYINERCQPTNERNTTWHLLFSLFPANSHMWPNQFGLTRKVLMATIGFGILILLSLYQAKQAEVLLVPYPPPKITLTDIEKLVSTGRSKLMFDDDVAIINYVSNMSTVLSDSIKLSPPINLGDYLGEELKLMHKHNGIHINSASGVLYLLSQIEPELCKNYVYHSFDDWTTLPSALIMRKGRRDMLDAMNVIVSERMSFVDDYVHSISLNEKCRQHIFPVYTQNPTYVSLKLAKISGAFAFLFFFLCLSLFVFLLELAYVWWRPKLKTFHVVIRFSKTLPPNRQALIMMNYSRMCELAANKG
jgi:hypothetical protein